jgi:hypothetical protein
MNRTPLELKARRDAAIYHMTRAPLSTVVRGITMLLHHQREGRRA